MKKLKKYIILIIILILLCILIGYKLNDDELTEKNISIQVIRDNNVLYENNITTTDKFLSDVLNNENINLKYEKTEYGWYIKSVCDVKESNTDKGLYYWSWYENDKYGESSISKCEIKDGSKYKLVYEFYEY